MTYDDVVLALQELCEIPLNQEDTDWQNILPSALEHAENRIFRELDFLATNIATVGAAFSVGNGRLNVPTDLLNVTYINICTPAVTSGDGGTRTPLERVPPEFLDVFWPSNTMTSGSPSVPSKFAMYGLSSGFTSTGAFTIRVAPAPSTAYIAEFVGPVRPSGLSEDVATTILSTRYPDLLIAACMVYLTGYQKDFGAKSSDPSAAISWEQTYTNLREGIVVESARQRSESVGWSTHTPSVLANKPRDRGA
jgi:hypothetical protein